MLVIMGPCSIHDVKAAKDYAGRLKEMKDRLAHDLLVAMRVYFEKPRTTVGWKGLINDPKLDGSFGINEGLRIGRQLLLDLNEMGMPACCEFLDMITPQYIADLVAWGAIGARTTESQIHRELASGLSCPVGFKNGTDGNIKIAVDAIRAAQAPHHFLSVTKGGHSAIVSTTGNEDCHIILRGGRAPNYDAANVDAAARGLGETGIPGRLMIDFSHGNSSKNPQKQVDVGRDVAQQVAGGEDRIFGIMAESHLKAGRQDWYRARNSSTDRASPTAASAGRTAGRCSRRWRTPFASAGSGPKPKQNKEPRRPARGGPVRRGGVARTNSGEQDG